MADGTAGVSGTGVSQTGKSGIQRRAGRTNAGRSDRTKDRREMRIMEKERKGEQEKAAAGRGRKSPYTVNAADSEQKETIFCAAAEEKPETEETRFCAERTEGTGLKEKIPDTAKGGNAAEAAALSEERKGVDLGTGSTGRLMLRLAVPAVTAQFVSMLYNIVDRIYIGHIPEAGSAPLTGVGLCFPLITLVMAFSSLVCAGGAPRAAIRMGQKDDGGAERILGNCFSCLLLTAVIITAVYEMAAEPLLNLFGGSENTLPYAVSYMRIYSVGTIFVMISLGMNLFLMSQGFSGMSMLTTLIGAVLNILLDPLFIFVFDMGVEGAAVATVISQAASALWVLLFLTGKRTKLRLNKTNLRLRKEIILPCLALGLSPFVMQSTESLLNICFNVSLMKYGGDLAVGAMTIIASTAQLLAVPMIGICQGGQPIISYNFGAGKNQRVKKVVKCQVAACFLYAAFFFGIAMLIPAVMAGMFSGDRELVDYTVRFMRIYHAGAFMIGVQIGCQQAFMALGQAKISLLMACLRKLILLIPLIFILPVFLQDDVTAVFLAEPVSDVLAALVTGILFFSKLPSILKKGPSGQGGV